jgi:MFS family permease
MGNHTGLPLQFVTILRSIGGLMPLNSPSFLAFYLCTFLYWGAYYVFSPILSPYVRVLGGSYTLVGLVMGIYGFSQLIFRVPFGIWADKSGQKKPIMLAGLLVLIFSCLGLGLSKDARYLIPFMGGAGFGASSWVAFSILFSNYFPRGQETRAFSYLMFCNRISQVFFSLVAGWIAEKYGWTAPFFVGAGLAFVGTLCWGFIYEEKSKEREPVSLKRLLLCIKEPMVALSSFWAAISLYVVYTTSYTFVPILATQLGASKIDLGVISFLFSGPCTLAMLFSGTILSGKLSEKQCISLGFLLSGIAIFYLPLVHCLWPVYLSQVLNGIGFGISIPPMMGLSVRYVREDVRSTAMGFFQSIYSLGMVFGPTVSGLIGENLGIQWIFFSTAILSMIGFFWALAKVVSPLSPRVCS